MANSTRFRSLVARTRGLERRLLPKVKPAGDYSALENDLLRAYRLLVHAEFESYFEDRALQIADLALNAFRRRGKAGRTLAALMAFSPLAPQSVPDSLGSTKPYENAVTRICRTVAQFKNEVKLQNHGIKEANVIGMLFPIGVESVDLDPTFMNTLNSYGTSRGESAHQSIRTQQPIDPVTEQKTVTALINEIEKLDLKIQKLRSI